MRSLPRKPDRLPLSACGAQLTCVQAEDNRATISMAAAKRTPVTNLKSITLRSLKVLTGNNDLFPYDMTTAVLRRSFAGCVRILRVHSTLYVVIAMRASAANNGALAHAVSFQLG